MVWAWSGKPSGVEGGPELVVCSSSGEVETVLYHEMPAMLLNELQKQQREIQELKSELSALRAVISQK
jgi:cAMP phosphodiesterase